MPDETTNTNTSITPDDAKAYAEVNAALRREIETATRLLGGEKVEPDSNESALVELARQFRTDFDNTAKSRDAAQSALAEREQEVKALSGDCTAFIARISAMERIVVNASTGIGESEAAAVKLLAAHAAMLERIVQSHMSDNKLIDDSLRAAVNLSAPRQTIDIAFARRVRDGLVSEIKSASTTAALLASLAKHGRALLTAFMG